MKHLSLIAAAIALAPTAQAASPITTQLKGPGGAPRGTATLTDAPGGVLVRIEATGLTPGWHGIHFHEKAECGDAGFKASGGHVHTAAPVVHGLLNPQANDSGDLPNIHAGADGKATADLFTPLAALRDGTPRTNLLDADGSAIVIHANADDYKTQPIGGAGDRIACGVVR